MASVNSTVGFQNLPAQSITTGTETALLVPASGTFGSGLPSPTLAAGAGLFVGFPPDIVGGIYDGHPFLVSIIGKITTGASLTFKPSLYQVPATIVAAGTSATLANDHAVLVGAATSSGAAGTQNFILQTQFLWDSTSKQLTGFVTAYQIAGVNLIVGTPNGTTAGTLQATTVLSTVGVGDLNFIPSFIFGTANAANAVTITEFLIDRV